MDDSVPDPLGTFSKHTQRLEIHPVARLTFVVPVLLVWGVDNPVKVAIVAVACFLMLFTAPINPITHPWQFLLLFAAVLAISLSVAQYGEANESVRYVGFGLKLLCLSCTAVVSFLGMGLSGVIRYCTKIWGRLAIPPAAAVCSLALLFTSYSAIRDCQRNRNITRHRSPYVWLVTLLYNWISYVLSLSSRVSLQLSTKWYGSPYFAAPSDRGFGAIWDWLVCILAFILILMVFCL